MTGRGSDSDAGDRLVVALVRGVHGLRGAVRVEVLSDDETRFELGRKLHPEGTDETLTIAWSQEDGPGLLVRFEGVSSREAAEALRGTYLEATVETTRLPDGEYYWHELVGVPVTTVDGEGLGTVRDIFRAGGGEVLVVTGGSRGEVLVPTIRSVVVELAPREGRIVVDREALGLVEGAPARKPRGRRTTRALKAGRPLDTAPPVEPEPEPRPEPEQEPDA